MNKEGNSMIKRNFKKFSPMNYARFIYQFIDRRVYGVWSDHLETPVFVHKKECLQKALDYRTYGYLDKISKCHIQKHLDNINTYYYTSNRGSDVTMFMVDIDAKDGETDAMGVGQWLVDNYFPNAYFERSTGGIGCHLYIFLNIKSIDIHLKRDNINQLIESFGGAVKHLVEQEGFESHVCSVRGTYHIKDREEQITSCGLLAKLPRPQSRDEFKRLIEAPVFDFSDFKQAVLDAENKQGDAHGDEWWEATEVPAVVPTGVKYNRLSTRFGDDDKLNQEIDLVDASDAFIRCRESCMALARHLGRIPTYEEWNTHYTNLGMNTGGDINNRRYKRFKSVSKYVQRTFDPLISKGYSFEVGMYIEILKLHIDSKLIQHVCEIAKYDRRLLFDDLDIALGYHAIQAFKVKKGKLALTAPVDGMIGFFKALKTGGQFNRSCNYNKAIAARYALQERGFITLLDENYTRSVLSNKQDGVAMKWGLGVNCPEYETWCQVAKDSIEYVKNNLKKKDMKEKIDG